MKKTLSQGGGVFFIHCIVFKQTAILFDHTAP